MRWPSIICAPAKLEEVRNQACCSLGLNFADRLTSRRARDPKGIPLDSLFTRDALGVRFPQFVHPARQRQERMMSASIGTWIFVTPIWAIGILLFLGMLAAAQFGS